MSSLRISYPVLDFHCPDSPRTPDVGYVKPCYIWYFLRSQSPPTLGICRYSTQNGSQPVTPFQVIPKQRAQRLATVHSVRQKKFTDTNFQKFWSVTYKCRRIIRFVIVMLYYIKGVSISSLISLQLAIYYSIQLIYLLSKGHLTIVWDQHTETEKKMAVIFETTFSNAFSWMEMFKFRLWLHWKFVTEVSINNIPTLVQIMVWRRPGDRSLSEPIMVSLPAHICVTRPQ